MGKTALLEFIILMLFGKSKACAIFMLSYLTGEFPAEYLYTARFVTPLKLVRIMNSQGLGDGYCDIRSENEIFLEVDYHSLNNSFYFTWLSEMNRQGKFLWEVKGCAILHHFQRLESLCYPT